MKKAIKSTTVLVSICAVISILLAVTNAVTAPIIEKNNAAAGAAAVLQVMPDAKNPVEMTAEELAAYTLPDTVTAAYKEDNGGYVFTLTTTGYSSGLVIMCGVNADGTVSGATCLASTETLGYEKTFGDNFKDKDAAGVDAVDTISGATKTTAAYRNAVKDALNAAIILGGGSVDLRSEEEILADNLSAALPAGEGKFSKVFITEQISGVDAVYNADNGAGTVCVVGEEFIAVDAAGTVVSAVDADKATAIAATVKTLRDSKLTAIDLTRYSELPSAVVSAQKTASGNYVLEMKGAGYGINGGDDYHPASGEYIYIRVALTKDGKIIDCLTVSQKETDNIGSVCAEEKFYGQFVGKTETDYENIDAIAGATLTTNGYKKAILRAFESVKIFEGV